MGFVVSDIGGTNARFAHCASRTGDLEHLSFERCADFRTIEAALISYFDRIRAAGCERVEGLVLAVASPVADDAIAPTNNHWHFSKARLRAALGLEWLLVINDFTAQAYAQINPSLDPHRTLTTPQPKTGQSLLVIGPGTGLGISALVSTIAGPLAINGEGGHASFSPADELESELLAFMRRRHDQPSAEHLVSGPGLENIHLFLTSRDGQETFLPAAEIGAGALAAAGRCRQSVHLLMRILATVLADQVLVFGAWQGAVICGGLAHRLGVLFADSGFVERLAARAAAQPLLANLPVSICQDEVAGLRGAQEARFSRHLDQHLICA